MNWMQQKIGKVYVAEVILFLAINIFHTVAYWTNDAMRAWHVARYETSDSYIELSQSVGRAIMFFMIAIIVYRTVICVYKKCARDDTQRFTPC